jgi:flagellar basal body P-ring formation protein FlgA
MNRGLALVIIGGAGLWPKPVPADAWQDLRVLQSEAERYVLSQTVGADRRVEARAGPMDSRLRLTACKELRAYLAPGSRLWGSTHVGLRCQAPQAWTVFVPVHVSVTGPAVFPVRRVARNQVIGPDDVEIRQTLLTSHAADVATDQSQVLDRVAAAELAPGYPIRLGLLRTAQAIRQGDKVKLVSAGSGFSVSADGVALENGGTGQTIRVKASSGRVVRGTVERPGWVSVTP